MKVPRFDIKYPINSFNMVEAYFGICLCETSHTALILPFTRSPWLKKILEFVFVKRLKLLYFIDSFLIVTKHFRNCPCETPQIGHQSVFCSFAMVEENFGICLYVKRLILP